MWIKCSERLPESNKIVITYYKMNQRPYSVHIGVGKVDNPPSVGVTHWMPLPEPPKED